MPQSSQTVAMSLLFAGVQLRVHEAASDWSERLDTGDWSIFSHGDPCSQRGKLSFPANLLGSAQAGCVLLVLQPNVRWT